MASENARLEQRQDRHKREQKRAYTRMLSGGYKGPRGPGAWWRKFRSWMAEEDGYLQPMVFAGFAALLLIGLAVVLGHVLLPEWEGELPQLASGKRHPALEQMDREL